MPSIHTSSSVLAAINAISWACQAHTSAATRLSTGYRVNSARDNTAGLQIATRLASQMSGTQVAMRNVQNGISLMQIADGVMGGLSSLFGRMRDLALQAANASTTEDDKIALQSEFTQLYRQAWEVRGTSYAGESLEIDCQSAANLLANMTVAKGHIVDTDFAAESARQVTNQMLMQSSAAMLEQSNGSKKMTLSLLQ